MIFRSKWLLLVASAAFLAAPAVAQNLKPVAVVSVASISKNLADVAYITRAAGMEDAGKSAAFFARALTAGIDKERPIGLYVLPQAGDFHAVAFIPVSDLKVLLEVQKEYVGTPKDVGNGILEIGTGRTAYLKEQAGWAYVAESKEHLSSLPADPVALLGDLPKKYNVAGKVMVQNIPEELRRMAIDQLKFGVERGLNAQRPGAKFDKQGAEQMTKALLGNVERLINDTDEIVIGLGISAEKKNTALDITISAKDGTVLAKQMALQMNAKTDFAGFLLPEAAVTFSAVSKASPEDIQQVGPAMKASREMWSKQIDDSPDFPADKREAAKRVLGQVFDVLEKTAASGKGDIGGALVLLPKSVAFIVGGYVADGPGMEKAFKDGLELMKDRPEFPKLQLNAGTYGDLKFHRLTADIPDREPEARELLGEKLEILVAFGPKSVLVCGGKDPEGLLKKVVDKSASSKDQSVPPGQFNISLLPILKFYKSVDDNPIVGNLISKLEQTGSDRITLVTEAGPHESKVHLEIQEGLIRAIGEAAKAFGAGGL